MKNSKIAASWNKIEPDDAADQRMLSAILLENHKDKKNPVPRLILVTAIALVAVMIVMNAGWFGAKEYTVHLAGDAVVYHKGSTSEADLNPGFPVSSRDLTDEELDMIFPETSDPCRATGTFRDENGELLRLEGAIGEAKVIYAREGFPVNDVVLKGRETSSLIDGIPVTAGYSMTRENRTVIFFGTFTLENTNIYVECSGDKNEAASVSQAHANLMLSIIAGGEPDFNQITK